MTQGGVMLLPCLSFSFILSEEQACKPISVENYPSGYPQYSALISSCDFFFTFRSFRQLRARLLLSRQDEIGVLEARLNQIDQEEASPFYLGSHRGDRNTTRAEVLTQIHSKLADYGIAFIDRLLKNLNHWLKLQISDDLIERCRRILTYGRAGLRDVASLHNWLDETGCLTEEETTYLKRTSDLITLASSTDSALKRLEDWIEDWLIQHCKGFRESLGSDISTSPNVYISSGSLVQKLARALMLFLITFLLLAPVVVCILVRNIPARIFVVVASTALYLTVLSQLTRPRMMELILAGATFATVLTVFVSNSISV
ncbi:hypothetical protein C7999DRAFT_41578 [Corynascus novoguineensis]|uniref:DUF6594 domain-containing protein n=1 Tax=Corynascus novoguineensis TaxID=1126955 RepID=A0AAN7HNC3_9PEZI|nr:hypothetical protein C7999DRAFT_41578 [Corynascus novoguineensis]